jgi:adenylate kinase
MHVILMGAQGAGKGTQAARIAPMLALIHLSTGDLFRAAIKAETALGREAKGYLDRGELVPDEVTLGIVEQRLAEIKAMPEIEGALFDGFPRTYAQAEGLDAMLDRRGEGIAAVVEIQVPVDVLIARLSGRRVCRSCGATYHVLFKPPRVEGVCDVCGGELYQRDDDKPEPIQRRLNLFQEETAPLLDYYRDRGLLVSVNGDQAEAKVTEDIAQAIRLHASVT